MDGIKKRLNESIQLRLSLFLSLTIVVVAVVAGIFSYFSAFDEAHELQDDVLMQVARLLDGQHISIANSISNDQANIVDEENAVIVLPLGKASMQLADKGSKPRSFPLTLADGLQTVSMGSEDFRVLVKTTTQGGRFSVAQPSSFRNEIAHDGALRAIMPMLILIPVLLLIVADLVRRMFRPIVALSWDIDQRSEQTLHPIDVNPLPSEVRPFALAINRLLVRVDNSVQVQRRFVADAAHELRSPLTALSLQAELLSSVEISSQAGEYLKKLRQGIERSRNLLEQLLTLAKAQANHTQADTTISIRSIYFQVLEDLMPMADAKQINIGIDGEQDAQVRASELDMYTLVKNVTDNAIRYAPIGGEIDLSLEVQDSFIVMSIRDNGPGIPLSERERVFDPFYRVLGSQQVGSGLGLSIVKVIVERMGGMIRLDFSNFNEKSGLKVVISIPMTE